MVRLRVCVGSLCHLRGAYGVIHVFKQMIEENKLHGAVELAAVHCMGGCDGSGVSVELDGKTHRVSPERAREFFRSSVIPAVPDSAGASGRPA